MLAVSKHLWKLEDDDEDKVKELFENINIICEHLENLKIQDLCLKSIPYETQILKNLLVLDLSKNKISKLENLKELLRLELLDVSDNFIQ